VARYPSIPRKVFGARALNVREQRAILIRLWPRLVASLNGSTLTVRGPLQPSQLSRSYRIRLTYKEAGVPYLWVEDPELVPRSAEEPIPHMYKADEHGPARPCLYYWKEREWKTNQPIATSIVPWLQLWLVYYELWHATGIWYGGGIDHPEMKRDVESDERAA
jgi:hypothetical protein